MLLHVQMWQVWILGYTLPKMNIEPRTPIGADRSIANASFSGGSILLFRGAKYSVKHLLTTGLSILPWKTIQSVSSLVACHIISRCFSQATSISRGWDPALFFATFRGSFGGRSSFSSSLVVELKITDWRWSGKAELAGKYTINYYT